MDQELIFQPVLALAALTFVVLMIMPVRRFRAVATGQATVADFAVGETAKVPVQAALVNRNYMNLLELPILFYAVCVAMFVTQTVDSLAVNLAWAYVFLRVIHSAIHLTYNNVVHRLTAFAISNVVLAVMWVMFGMRVLNA